MFTRKLLGFAFAAALTIGGLTPLASAQRSLTGKVAIDGSSTVFPISQAVAEEFGSSAPRVRVTVGVSGTGGGFKRFSIGETDISDASRPIKPEESDKAKASGVSYIEIPVAYDGLSIVVNKENDWVKSLTVADLKKIFLDSPDKAKTWKDVNPAYPDVAIKLYMPGTDSGTFDYFKEVVADKASIRPDASVSEDDNVLVRGVSGDKGALGFFGCAYYFENADKLRAVPIDGGEGPILPTPTTIEDGSYAPFSRPLFIYVNRKSADRPEVKAFVDFYLKNAGKLADEVGYVRLPSDIYALAAKNFATGKTGTQFHDAAGKKVKGSLVQIYK